MNMMLTASHAYGLCVAAALVFSCGLIFSRHMVVAALCLMGCFCAVAGVWLIMSAEFLAVILVMVYVGAVMVLFLFVIMMLILQEKALQKQRLVKHALPVFFLGMLVALLWGLFWRFNPSPLLSHTLLGEGLSFEIFARALFEQHGVVIACLGMLLFEAMIVAVILTLRERRGSLRQDISEQVRARKEDRLHIVRHHPLWRS